MVVVDIAGDSALLVCQPEGHLIASAEFPLRGRCTLAQYRFISSCLNPVADSLMTQLVGNCFLECLRKALALKVSKLSCRSPLPSCLFVICPWRWTAIG